VDNTRFQDVDSLTFNQSGFTVNGASLIFNGNTTIAANNTSGTNTIANIIDQEPVSISPALALDDHAYQVAGSSTLNMTGVVTSHSSLGLLDKTGPGVLKLSATSNNYTGPTDIHGGNLLVGAINNLPNQTAVAVDAGATFDLGNTNVVIGSLAGPGHVNLTGTLLTGRNNQCTTFSGNFNGIGNLVKQPQQENLMQNTSCSVERLNEATSPLCAAKGEPERAVGAGKDQSAANPFRRRRFDRVSIGFWLGGAGLGMGGCFLGAFMPYHHPVAGAISVLWWGIYCGCFGASIGALIGLFTGGAPSWGIGKVKFGRLGRQANPHRPGPCLNRNGETASGGSGLRVRPRGKGDIDGSIVG
jgi:autotransporter-associated beta strand protein